MPESRNQKHNARTIARGLAVVATLGLASVGAWSLQQSLRVDAQHGTPSADSAARSEVDTAMRALTEKVYPSFVMIGQGSGVCISPDGYMVTNHHVSPEAVARYDIDGRPIEISVRLSGSGKAYSARPVGADPRGDIVVLKINVPEGESLPFTVLGDSDLVKVGDIALAVGNPFLLSGTAFEPSVSCGIVTAVGRAQSGYSDCIQVDTAVNPGNSGGPTYNKDGEIIGINGRILTRHARRYNTGAGFAISSNQIKRFLDVMKQNPGGALHVPHGLVSGLAMKHDRRLEGAEVLSVRPGSMADISGFKDGDIVLGIGPYTVRGIGGFYGKLGNWPIQSVVEFTIRRGDKNLKLKAELDVPVEANQSIPYPISSDKEETDYIFSDAKLTPAITGMAAPFPLPSMYCVIGATMKGTGSTPSTRGMEVTGFPKEESGPATNARDLLKEGDLITHLNGRRIRYESEMRDCLYGFKGGDKVKLTVKRGESSSEVEITLGASRGTRVVK